MMPRNNNDMGNESLSDSASVANSDTDITSLTAFKEWPVASVLSQDLGVGNSADLNNSSASLMGMSTFQHTTEFPISTDIVPLRFSSDKANRLLNNDDFELMVNDMRSTFVCWLKKTQLDFRSRRDDLIKAAQELQDEKRSFVERMKQERSLETEKLAVSSCFFFINPCRRNAIVTTKRLLHN